MLRRSCIICDTPFVYGGLDPEVKFCSHACKHIWQLRVMTDMHNDRRGAVAYEKEKLK